MNKQILLVIFALVGCGGSANRVGGNGFEDMALGGGVRAFVPATRAAGYVTDGLNLISTDATGPIGCSLVDPSANPGLSVSRVSFKMLGDLSQPDPCPSNAVAVGQTTQAGYEAWDAAGNLVASVPATGGAASFSRTTLTGTSYRCTVSLQLTFPHGDIFTDTFSYEYATDNFGNITVTKGCSN